jgi:hypothetical protein
VVASCFGFSVAAKLASDNRTVTFYTLANTIDALFTEFSGTYRFELRCIVVKARCRGCPWLGRWTVEPWPPSYGGGLASPSVVLVLGVGPIGDIWPSCGTFAGGVDPPCIACSLLFRRGLSMSTLASSSTVSSLDQSIMVRRRFLVEPSGLSLA